MSLSLIGLLISLYIIMNVNLENNKLDRMWKEMVNVLTQNFLGQRGNSQRTLGNTEIEKWDMLNTNPTAGISFVSCSLRICSY
jgi:hypothetical protein